MFLSLSAYLLELIHAMMHFYYSCASVPPKAGSKSYLLLPLPFLLTLVLALGMVGRAVQVVSAF